MSRRRCVNRALLLLPSPTSQLCCCFPAPIPGTTSQHRFPALLLLPGPTFWPCCCFTAQIPGPTSQPCCCFLAPLPSPAAASWPCFPALLQHQHRNSPWGARGRGWSLGAATPSVRGAAAAEQPGLARQCPALFPGQPRGGGSAGGAAGGVPVLWVPEPVLPRGTATRGGMEGLQHPCVHREQERRGREGISAGSELVQHLCR